MSSSVIRRLVATGVLLASFAGPALAASAAGGFRVEGILGATNPQRQMLTVTEYAGNGTRGRPVPIHLLSSTRIERDGKQVSLRSLRDGERVVVAGRRDAHRRLIATTVDATSPPRPDGPAVAVPGECFYYQCTPGAPPVTATGTMTITISNYTFDPPASIIPTGTVVTVRNTDSVAHTFSGDHLDSGALNSGAPFTVEFTTPGTYRFFCAIHPFMNGVIEVRA